MIKDNNKYVMRKYERIDYILVRIHSYGINIFLYLYGLYMLFSRFW